MWQRHLSKSIKVHAQPTPGEADWRTGLSKSSFFKLVRKWKDAGTPFPDPVEGMPALKHGGFLYRYQDVMKFFKSIGLLSDSDNQ